MKKNLDNISSGADTPLDMTVRHRGEPPSYDQTINNPGYRSSFRTTVIHNGVPPPVVNRDKLPSGMYQICFSLEYHCLDIFNIEQRSLSGIKAIEIINNKLNKQD